MFRIGALSPGILLVMTASLPFAHAATGTWDGNSPNGGAGDSRTAQRRRPMERL